MLSENVENISLPQIPVTSQRESTIEQNNKRRQQEEECRELERTKEIFQKLKQIIPKPVTHDCK